MALNLKSAVEVTDIPSRVRGAVDTAERDLVFKEFFELLEIAANKADEAAKSGRRFGGMRIPVEGTAECNKYTSALQAFDKAHPMAAACLTTAGGKYDGKGRYLSTYIYAAARPTAPKVKRLLKKGFVDAATAALWETSEGAADEDTSGDFSPAAVGVTVRKPE